MSVVGFDIGNLNCYIAVARQGGIEVITNDYSLHATPACVSFGSKNRQMGVAARQQVNTNFKNTIINFKHLVGRKFSDPITQKFVPYIPCQVVQLPDDHIGFKVYYLDEERVFTPEQILAALLTKLKIVLESGGLEDVKKVTDCVVTVPTYFTDIQRRAVAAAVHVAGLNQLRILNESTATALAYGIYKQDLPEESAKPKHVLFLDVGHSATQTALVAYHKGKLSMLGSNFSLDVGGLLFDVIIRDYFRKLFIDTYKIDAKTNPRAWLRLLDESEKVKKQMSANSTPIPLNIECFMEDKDVTGKLQRVEFEELAAPLFEKVRVLVTDLLAETRKQAADVDEIEIIGGSSRIPAIRKIVHDIFGKEPKTTMNQDEAVARGAAMQCAILSPSFRVREFSVKDAQPFGIRLTYEGGESDVFVEKDEFPFSKLLTFYRDQPFQLDASYTHPNTVPQSSRHIGSWRILNVVPQPNGDNSKVKVKVRVNPNGVFSVSSASMFETVEVDEKEEEPPKAEANGAATDGAPAPPAEEEVKEKKKKTKTTSVELPIQELLPVTYNVDHFVRVEQEMRDADLREKKKADAKNSVEEYVYDMRDKLSDSLVEFISEKDAEDFRSLLTATEDWLYDEGEDAPMAHYEARLADLKKFGEPVVERYREFHSRQVSLFNFDNLSFQTAFDQLDQSINRARKAFEEYAGGSEAYAHIESKDMEKVLNAIDDKKKWVDEQRGKQERRPKTEPPVVFTHEIKSAQTTFENVVLPILNKPKPKPPKVEEPPPPPPTQPQQQNNPPTADGAASQEQMDVE